MSLILKSPIGNAITESSNVICAEAASETHDDALLSFRDGSSDGVTWITDVCILPFEVLDEMRLLDDTSFEDEGSFIDSSSTLNTGLLYT